MTAPSPARAEVRQAVLLGAVCGLVLATGGILALRGLRPSPEAPPAAPETAQSAIPVFRATGEDGCELVLLPAGPDGTGEPRLSAALYPQETPPRVLASFFVANPQPATTALAPGRPSAPRTETGAPSAGPAATLHVDLAATPVRGRFEDGAIETFEIAPVGPGSTPLPAADGLRARALGGSLPAADVPAGSQRSFLIALPKGRKFEDLRVVEWGETELLPGRYDPGRLRALRTDPAGVPQAAPPR